MTCWVLFFFLIQEEISFQLPSETDKVFHTVIYHSPESPIRKVFSLFGRTLPKVNLSRSLGGPGNVALF